MFKVPDKETRINLILNSQLTLILFMGQQERIFLRLVEDPKIQWAAMTPWFKLSTALKAILQPYKVSKMVQTLTIRSYK
jgi:hypothetical protein